MLKSKILFKMTGSIACYKACGIISKLVQTGHEVQVVTSKSALQFVGNATLEGLTGKPVISDLWAAGNIMDHIYLMRWADLILVAPASANYINKIAQGVGDDLLTTLFLAHDFKKPFLIAPAMNTNMYMHPATQKSIQTLRSFGTNGGLEILETASGVLACGEVGFGKLLDPELVFAEVQKALERIPTELLAPISSKIPFNSKTTFTKVPQVLITAGGTQEPIDQVRVITNRSSGRTGANIAETLIEMGIDVTFLHSENSILPRVTCKKINFRTFQDLQSQLSTTLSQNKFDWVIHLAAVSDYSLDNNGYQGKLSSDSETMTLQLKKNPKLVNHLREFSCNRSIQVVAFKMTVTPEIALRALAVEKLFTESRADIVIQNDISEIDLTSEKHLFHWCEPGHVFAESRTFENTNQLALALAEKILAVTILNKTPSETL